MERLSSDLANDHYRHCYGSENFYKYFKNIAITEGIKEVAEKEQCFWFLDVIISYQIYPIFKSTSFQNWKLTRVDNCEFEVTGNDGNGNILVVQKIPFSDFFFDKLIVLFKGIGNNNQYLVHLHQSTGDKHLHIIANRIDFHGKNQVKSHNIGERASGHAEVLSKERNSKTAQEITGEKKAEF
ncbi:relaxase/mobilization nuclease domain-containing protein [Chryseobacterium sp. MYb264]|uniref:DUF6876 family protein n=1 Tax=Chryseobacterium sp. MYb264 TaxID=2745153 RepID=UPI002E0E1B89|nr:DUF6876 family protein [Chryseobacterium sp. MYb264]WSO27548.1 relaxase/mobilization nuclease domain-containing protein [Chryseobacterium sp. MYb264]